MIHIAGTFYRFRICSSPVLNFQTFLYQQKCHFRLLLGRFLSRTPQNGLFQKKSKQGQGLRTWDFQGYWRRNMWKFQGSIKREVKFLGVYKKKSCNFHGSWFLTLKFQKDEKGDPSFWIFPEIAQRCQFC